MARLRITIEYDFEDGMEEGETLEQAVSRETKDWMEGNVDLRDILANGDPVKFELIP